MVVRHNYKGGSYIHICSKFGAERFALQCFHCIKLSQLHVIHLQGWNHKLMSGQVKLLVNN